MKAKWQVSFIWTWAKSILKRDWSFAVALLKVPVQLAANRMYSYVLDNQVSEEFDGLQQKEFLIHESPSGQWTSYSNFAVAMEESNKLLLFLQMN